MKILIIDNYDSFTFNLYQYCGEILMQTEESYLIDVVRNDAITINEIRKRNYDRVIISPGPGHPADKEYFGVCGQVIKDLGRETPLLGVCLGMQGIAFCFGGSVVRARKPMHGKMSTVKHDGKGLFKDLPQSLEVMRYHSLIAEKKSLPEELEISAQSDGEIMGLRHRKFPVEGIQFHPESFATEGGKEMLANFLFKK